MKRLIQIFILFVCHSIYLSGSYTITGRYVTKEAVPIAGAVVCLISSGDTLAKATTGNENNQITGLSWIGDVATKTAYLFLEAFFKKK